MSTPIKAESTTAGTRDDGPQVVAETIEVNPGGCQCGHSEPEAAPVLDVRAIPHAIRHAVVFGALEAIPVRGSLVLVAHHDPVPLLAQIEQRNPGGFTVSYLERGPEEWHLEFTRLSQA